jgi:hypothetical protein
MNNADDSIDFSVIDKNSASKSDVNFSVQSILEDDQLPETSTKTITVDKEQSAPFVKIKNYQPPVL